MCCLTDSILSLIDEKKENSGRQMSSNVPIDIQFGATGSVPVSKYLGMGFPNLKLGNKDTKLERKRNWKL